MCHLLTRYQSTIFPNHKSCVRKKGVPKGYNAFFTRGYAGRLEYLKGELEVAKEISGLQTPNLLVYGGGDEIRKFCIDNSLVYVQDFINDKSSKKDGKNKRK